MTLTAGVAGALALIAAALVADAWRLRAALAGVVAASAVLGALVTLIVAVSDTGDASAPLIVCGVLTATSAVLLAIGRLFNRLLGAEPD